MQRNVNFVGLEKCCKMSIYLQRSVLIQRRTSDLIFIILVASRDLILTARSYPVEGAEEMEGVEEAEGVEGVEGAEDAAVIP